MCVCVFLYACLCIRMTNAILCTESPTQMLFCVFDSILFCFVKRLKMSFEIAHRRKWWWWRRRRRTKNMYFGLRCFASKCLATAVHFISHLDRQVHMQNDHYGWATNTIDSTNRPNNIIAIKKYTANIAQTLTLHSQRLNCTTGFFLVIVSVKIWWLPFFNLSIKSDSCHCECVS